MSPGRTAARPVRGAPRELEQGSRDLKVVDSQFAEWKVCVGPLSATASVGDVIAQTRRVH